MLMCHFVFVFPSCGAQSIALHVPQPSYIEVKCGFLWPQQKQLFFHIPERSPVCRVCLRPSPDIYHN